MERPVPARALVAVGASVLVPLLLTFGGAPAPLAGASAEVAAPPTSVLTARVTAPAGPIIVSRRASVNTAYVTSFAAGLGIPTGYTGSDAACRPGTTSAVSRSATLRAVNFVRALSGLAPVRFSTVLNARSQRTALMMSANHALSHTPPPSWRCYSAIGAANAGRSNLALSYPSLTSAGVVGLYMTDPGAGNEAVGHRRWLLHPFTTTMGSGSTNTANAMTVIGPTAAARPNPAWVSWPTAGYFPAPLEPKGRWSLSAGNARTDFRRATVHVYRNGQAIRAVRQPVHNGYGMPTLVWQIPAKQAGSGTFHVVVSGVHRAGTRKVFARTYDVRMFTPSS